MSRLPLLTLEQADASIQPNLEKAINSEVTPISWTLL